MNNPHIIIITALLTFFSKLLLDYTKNKTQYFIKKSEYDLTIAKWLKIFEYVIKQNNKYSVGPLSLNLFFWKHITKKNQNGWKIEDITVITEDIEKNRSRDLMNFINEAWEKESSKDVKLYNDQERCGLLDIFFDNDKPKLVMYKTSYKEFFGTNKNYVKIPNRFLTDNEKFLIDKPDGYKYLKESILSNDLATATTLITKDNKVILSKRSGEVAVLSKLIHTSIAEGMSWSKDKLSSNSAPNPFKTIQRGAKEELNIEINIKNIELTGFGIYRDFAQPFVVAKIKLNKTCHEIKEIISQIKESEWEGKLFFVNFNIKEIAPFLFDAKLFGVNLKTAELAKASLLLCLIQQYGVEKVSSKLRKYYVFTATNKHIFSLKMFNNKL